jgi:hypothetical protein
LSNFGLKQGSFHASMEKSMLWTARLSTVGSRSVVVLDVDDIKAHMRKAGVVGKNCKDYMKEIGIAGAHDFFKQGFTAFAGTVARGDVLFVPANVVILEHVGDNSDCFGLRWAMVLSRDRRRYKAFKNTAESKMTPSTHISKAIVAAVKAASEELA